MLTVSRARKLGPDTVDGDFVYQASKVGQILIFTGPEQNGYTVSGGKQQQQLNGMYDGDKCELLKAKFTFGSTCECGLGVEMTCI